MGFSPKWADRSIRLRKGDRPHSLWLAAEIEDQRERFISKTATSPRVVEFSKLVIAGSNGSKPDGKASGDIETKILLIVTHALFDGGMISSPLITCD